MHYYNHSIVKRNFITRRKPSMAPDRSADLNTPGMMYCNHDVVAVYDGTIWCNMDKDAISMLHVFVIPFPLQMSISFL